MKKTLTIATILLIGFLFSSCLKEKHSVRLKNEYYLRLNNVVVGSAELGDIDPGGESSYKSINTGNFSISGTASNGQALSGSGTISGKGKHKWTITINSSGQASLKEDK